MLFSLFSSRLLCDVLWGATAGLFWIMLLTLGWAGAHSPNQSGFITLSKVILRQAVQEAGLGDERKESKRGESGGRLGTWTNIYKDKKNRRGSWSCCQIRRCNQSALRQHYLSSFVCYEMSGLIAMLDRFNAKYVQERKESERNFVDVLSSMWHCLSAIYCIVPLSQ